jgi:hypothetical protein
MSQFSFDCTDAPLQQYREELERRDPAEWRKFYLQEWPPEPREPARCVCGRLETEGGRCRFGAAHSEAKRRYRSL